LVSGSVFVEMLALSDKYHYM